MQRVMHGHGPPLDMRPVWLKAAMAFESMDPYWSCTVLLCTVRRVVLLHSIFTHLYRFFSIVAGRQQQCMHGALAGQWSQSKAAGPVLSNRILSHIPQYHILSTP